MRVVVLILRRRKGWCNQTIEELCVDESKTRIIHQNGTFQNWRFSEIVERLNPNEPLWIIFGFPSTRKLNNYCATLLHVSFPKRIIKDLQSQEHELHSKVPSGMVHSAAVRLFLVWPCLHERNCIGRIALTLERQCCSKSAPYTHLVLQSSVVVCAAHEKSALAGALLPTTTRTSGRHPTNFAHRCEKIQ